MFFMTQKEPVGHVPVMLKLNRRLGYVMLVVLLALGLAPAAGAVTVQADMVGAGDDFESEGLLFSSFSFDFGNADSSQFTLTIEGTRVTLAGPMEVSGTAEDDYQMSYRVSSLDPLLKIEGVSFATPTTLQDDEFPTFMQAIAVFENDSSVGVSSLANTVFGATNVQETSGVIAGELALNVQVVSSLRSGGTGDFVDLASLSNEFMLVPEPTTAAMLALGLLGLAWSSRPRG